jgi:hypothetical protein
MSYFSHTGRPTTEQKIVNGVLRDKGVLYSKNVIHTVSRYTRECHFIEAVSAWIFTQLKHALQQYAQISYTEFHPKRKINVKLPRRK